MRGRILRKMLKTQSEKHRGSFFLANRRESCYNVIVKPACAQNRILQCEWDGIWRREMNDLEMYREQLALCDDKIIDALVERNAIIEKIMAYKEKYGMPILQPAQEAKQQRRLDEKLKDNKYQEEIQDVFKRILRNSKRIQARKLFSYNIVLIGLI